jgi:hypothetical protein
MVTYAPRFENKFFKDFKKRFSNVVVFRDKEESLLNKLDGKVLEVIDKIGESGDKPITETKIRRKLDKKTLVSLKKFGGLKASIKRLEGIGVIYRDKEWGWRID